MTTNPTAKDVTPENNSVHALLISEAQKWLWRNGCSMVITDMSHGGRETPDAKKCFRRMPETGMGMMRWFCTTPGIIRVEELPDHWGLMEWRSGKMWIVKKAEPQRHEEGAREEIQLLLSAIRRLGPLRPQGVNVKFYTQEYYTTLDAPVSRATLGIGPAVEETFSQPDLL